MSFPILDNVAKSGRHTTFYLSCGAASNFDETFRAVARDIPLLYHSDYGPTAHEALRGPRTGQPGPGHPRARASGPERPAPSDVSGL